MPTALCYVLAAVNVGDGHLRFGIGNALFVNVNGAVGVGNGILVAASLDLGVAIGLKAVTEYSVGGLILVIVN